MSWRTLALYSMGLAVETIQLLSCCWSDMTSTSTRECNESDAGLENMQSVRELEPYLDEPVASTDDTPVDDDDSQDNERLLSTN